MALKMFVSSLDGISEDLHGFYGKTEHGFKLQVEGAIPEKDVAGLKHTLNEIKEDRDNLKKLIKPWKEAGLLDKGADDVLSLMEEHNKLKSIDPSKEADRLAAEKAEALNREWASKFNTETGRLTTELNQALSMNREMVISNEIRDAAQETKANPKLIDPIIRQFIGVKEDGSVFVRNPQSGTPDFGPDGMELTVAQKMHQMRESQDYMVLFEGTGNSGSGNAGFAPPGKTASGKLRIHVNDTKAIEQNMDAIADGNVEWVEN